MNTQYINLDISKALKPNRSITIGQGDLGGTTIVATIYDNGSLLSLSGLSARFFLRLPDSLGYVEDDNCTVSGNAITYVVDEEHCASVSGVTQDAYFALYSGTTRIYSTERFTVKILQSAADGVQPAGSWTNGVEEWLEDASETLSGYVADSNARIGATINSANAAVEQMREDVDDAIGDTDDAIARADAAIDAMGDISELAVPLMSADTRGGAKLGDGLAVDDGTLHVGQLAKASTGEVYGPLASVTAKGHAEQVSTTGKNLLPNNATSQTINGVTFTVNADGSVHVKGTATARANFFLNGTTRWAMDDGEYVLSGTSSQNTDVSLEISTSSTPINYYSVNVSRHSISFTLSNEAILAYIVVYANNTVDSVVYPQLELGSTATGYEPYSGGLPSPRPDWEQPIEVVRGRNLWSKDKFIEDAIAAGIAAPSSITGYLSIHSTNDVGKIISFGGKESSRYTLMLSGHNSNSTYSTWTNIAFHYNDGTNGSMVQLGAADTMTAFVSAEGKTVDGLIARNGSGIFYLDTNSFGIFEGELKVEQYVPYGYVGLEVIPEHSIENGSITLSGDDVATSTRVRTEWIDVSTGDVLSISCTSEKGTVYVYGISANASYTSTSVVFEWAQCPKTYTVQAISHLRLAFRIGTDGASVLDSSEIILTINGERYRPRSTTPIPLPQRGWVGGLPDGTSDVLSIDSAGKVEWEMGTNETVFDGVNKVMTGVDTTQEIPMFWSQATLDSAKASNGVAFFSSHFIAREVSGSSTALRNNEAVFGWSRGDINPLLRLRTLKFSTVADFNTWLQSNPVTVLYPLATPVTEDCGYVDLPDIPSEATVSIPELEDLGLTFWVDGDGTIRAAMREWYERAHSEYADRITNLESAVAQLVTEG